MNYAELFTRSLRLFPEELRQKHSIDIQLFIEDAFGFSRTDFWINKNQPITDKTALRRFYRMRQRRLKKEPVAYILKKRFFYDLEFYVDKHVLIPRPETEILVETAIKQLKPLKSQSRVLDIGAGSGIISICLAKFANANVTAVDVCKKALSVFKKNIKKHNLENQITPILSDLFPPIPKEPFDNRFDMIVSNPPYVSENDWNNLEPGVKDFEPKHALVAEENGLTLIKDIITRAPAYLKENSPLLIEIGYGQEPPVRAFLEQNKWKNIQFVKDYAGVQRVACAML